MKSIHNRVVKRYPQAVPHELPPALALQAAKLRRWTIALFVVTAGLLTFAGYIVFNQRRGDAAKPASLPRDETLFAAPKSLIVVKPRTTPVADAPGSPALAEKSASPPAVSPAPSAKSDPEQRERFLEAIGGLSAAHLYQSYLNIGLVADAVESESYTKADAGKILQAVGDVANFVDKQLDAVARTGLDQDDEESLQRIRKVTGLLRTQLTALQSYWATSEMDHVTRYRQARDLSWNELKDILGIDE